MSATPCPSLVYEMAKDFGYSYARPIISDGDDLRLDDLEEAIYSFLIGRPALAYYTAICRTQAEKAARRVFERAHE